MRAFTYLRAASVEAAAQALSERDAAVLKAGGVDLLDRMKERVDEPAEVVGLVDLPPEARRIEADGATIRIGALATLAEIAASDVVRRGAPSLAEAAGQAASPQLRHMATLGGNLGQHTRCGYYRHRSFPCLKRGDETCPVRAPGGVQDLAGVFANDPCASAHPSSLAPPLGALGARVLLASAGRAAEALDIPFDQLWATPVRGRASDLALDRATVIRAVEVPRVDAAAGHRTAYLEIRQKAAFDWALVSCAVWLRLDGDRIADARVWLGSVAPTPWRSKAAEDALRGQAVADGAAAKAGAAAAAGATPLPGTRYKVAQVEVAVRRAVDRAAGRA